MTGALLGWGVLALAAVYAAGLVRAAHRATSGAPGADRAGLLRRAVAATTGLVAARALAPGEDVVTLVWGLLVAAWAWALLVGAASVHHLPWRAAGGPGPRRTAADLAAEAALLVVAVAVLVP
ncbi:MAG: hypothetical protein PGN11_18895 [Quadrisphaera sp.]